MFILFYNEKICYDYYIGIIFINKWIIDQYFKNEKNCALVLVFAIKLRIFSFESSFFLIDNR